MGKKLLAIPKSLWPITRKAHLHICKEKKMDFDLALIHEPSTNSLLMYSIFVEDFALENCTDLYLP
jgi:hypothetical protein